MGIETYVWIAGISGAMSALFVISALGLALASCAPRPLRSATILGLLSIVALAASLLSKERALVEPALLLAAFASAAHTREAASAGPGRASLDRLRAAGLAAAHLLVVLIYFFGWRPVVLGSTQATLPPIGGSAATQIASALANWPAKLAWLFFPLHSSTSDVIRVVDTAVDPLAWLGACLALGSAAAWWLCLRRGRPVTALGLAWIWIAYGPTAGLVPMLHANGERYLFLSAFGASLIVADLVTALVRRTGPAPGLALAAALLAFLAQRTSARIPEWESNLTLFQHEIAREPAYREGYFLVAAELAARGRFAEAVAPPAHAARGGPGVRGEGELLESAVGTRARVFDRPRARAPRRGPGARAGAAAHPPRHRASAERDAPASARPTARWGTRAGPSTSIAGSPKRWEPKRRRSST